MNPMATSAPFVAHRIPGRLRIKTYSESPSELSAVVAMLSLQPGIRTAKAEPLTGSIVVHFDPVQVEEAQILTLLEVGANQGELSSVSPVSPPPPREERPHSVIHEAVTRRGPKAVRRVRVAVRGLDRNSSVGRAVVDRLMSRPGVNAKANPLTGRVLIEFDEEVTELRELLGDISEVELPSGPGEDDPTHPLDPAPLTQSSVRVGGSAVGLTVLAGRRLIGAEGAILSNPAWAYASAAMNIAQSIPWIRNSVRGVVGRNVGDLALGLPEIGLSALVSSPLSLLVNGVGALRLFLTVSARRQSWRSYEERLGDAPSLEPGETIRLESGEITPMPSVVIEGAGAATAFDGFASHFGPGSQLPAGAKLRGSGPFVLELVNSKPFEPKARLTPFKPTLTDRYQEWNAPISLLFSTALGLGTRSMGRAFEALLCLSPRAATAGSEAANLNAAARVIRGGAVVVGTRPHRHIRLPQLLILESARLLTDGLEISAIKLVEPGFEAAQALELAGQVSHAGNSPWGDTFGPASLHTSGSFANGCARATIEGVEFTLELDERRTVVRGAAHQRLILHRLAMGVRKPMAEFAVRPRLASELVGLLETCRKHNVEVVVLAAGDLRATATLAKRANVKLVYQDGASFIFQAQERGERVAYVSDGAHGAEPFAQCDLAIGMTSGRGGRFSARADLLAFDLGTVSAIIEAGAIANRVERDSVGLGVLANVVGAGLCVLGPTGIVAASRAVYLATLGSYANAAFRFRGGERSVRYTDRFTDPRPEQRWGKRSVEEVLRELDATYDGLSSEEAERRLRSKKFSEGTGHKIESNFLKAVGAQLRSPLIGLMAGGAALTFAVGTPVEFALVSLTIVGNVLFGAWQEQQVQGASQALAGLTPSKSTVIRSSQAQVISAKDLVAGDIIMLSPGDRVPADARVIDAESLEVDEAPLTGESTPVPKSAHAASYSGRILLEGSDVTVGWARAVVVAVGRKTRMGTIAAAIAQDERSKNPLNNRLAKLLQQFLPIAAAAGGIVFVAGLVQGRHWMSELVLATTLALSAIPEGLPLLAGVAEVAVSSRLSKRGAYLRRLGSVEALGRVDVACTDKTGTLTQGKLRLSLVATVERVAMTDTTEQAESLSQILREVVLTAALASPHPAASNVRAHPTDVAVIEGAKRLGLGLPAEASRQEDAPFEPTRAFHASRVSGRIVVKGAPEAIVARCSNVRTDAGDVSVESFGRQALLQEAERIAGRGMRVLMIAEGGDAGSVDDPQNLTALGFIGIRDPLRPTAIDAVARCQKAGVRVIILTGDHPATAKAIAAEVGLVASDGGVLTGVEMSAMTDEQLDSRLKGVTVVARVTPLDKVRIVESLQRIGHVVAMTGDGVNDAPALRLSDVGIAMGVGGTEVARQAADVVLGDDNFSTLVEALVEGRGFWRNIRRTLGLLLGGILGELGFVAIASAVGLPTPLNTRQILAMNLITFGLPTLAVALQEPEHRNLAGLAREGTTALEKPLRADVTRRALATIVPSMGAYVLARPLGQAQAQTVAFGTAIGSQLTQTLDSGQVDTGLTKSVVGAVGTSLALMLASMFVPQARVLLTLAIPTLQAGLLMAGASCSAPLVARAFAVPNRTPVLKALPAA